MTAQIPALELLFFDIPNTADLHADAAQAVQSWNLDPERVRRALLLLSYDYVHAAHTEKIDPEFDVKSLSRPHIVHTVHPDRHTCTCEDATFGGQVCMHRLAVYLYRQRLQRSAAQAKTNQLLSDLGF